MIISISEAEYVIILGVLFAYVALVWWSLHDEEQEDVTLARLSFWLPIGMIWSFYHAVCFGLFSVFL
ncbi:hypothetical protein BBM40_22105 [Vibrio parahaemolyticus]|uniref:hypothetical protein n=1 Tax=Vibrio parahaemolyticus TaxID=670 RepID=UPI00086A878A|nr:hypothetical protein [Vibrio parahaemolyticus]ODZ44156.1 hypothetical protein BBM40_22105 [Vibrio parahaemolyticus]